MIFSQKCMYLADPENSLIRRGLKLYLSGLSKLYCTLLDMIFLPTDATMKISYTFHLLELQGGPDITCQKKSSNR
jgi:hypothetical protein